MINKIFEYIIDNAPITSKKSVIDYFSKKDKVYTKKVSIPGEPIIANDCKIEYVSVTSLTEKFDEVGPHDVRVNFKNAFGTWVNVYLSTLPNAIAEEIGKRLNLK